MPASRHAGCPGAWCADAPLSKKTFIIYWAPKLSCERRELVGWGGGHSAVKAGRRGCFLVCQGHRLEHWACAATSCTSGR